jgi:DNA mismatch endonuclease (patch repair protein)
MFKVRVKDTSPERRVRKVLRQLGCQFETNVKGLPGTPDIVLFELGIIIFVNGCFWHHHHCNKGLLPKTNRIIWMKKIIATEVRDIKNAKKLKELGWEVVTIWECQTYSQNRIKQILETNLF